ncbi:XisI protein [Haliscomenobacter sp.]|jgi:hypothetical protein|uniref:XisI protein n=1 Tax=Haliscomenobacter sp. TaxID=2717303 RepID=UPI00359477EB
MDKVTHYQDLLVAYLQEYAATPYANAPGLEKMLITDRENGHFQLVSTGWHKGAFSFDVLMHFDVRNGKIWVMQNWTEEEVAEEFVRRGVPAQDIVLGFVPEEGRVYSGFGVG